MKNLFAKLAILGVLMLPLTACGNNDAAAAVPPISYSFVSTITPRIGDIVVIGEYIGTIQPNQQVSVIPGIPGEVKSVHFAVGDRVEAGDILFTIDSADIITNINSLEAQPAVQNAAVSAAQTNIQFLDDCNSDFARIYGDVHAI